MKKLKKGLDIIKELKKTERGKAVLFFSFFAIFFLIVILFLRFSESTNNYIPPVEEEKEEIMDLINLEGIENNNFNYNYVINLDGIVHNYIGSVDGNINKFSYNNEEYYKNLDIYYKKNPTTLAYDLIPSSPIVFENLVNYNALKLILDNSTYISKTEFPSLEKEYNYTIETNKLIEVINNQDSTDSSINTLKFKLNEKDEIVSVSMDLNNYIKSNLINQTLIIELNYSEIGNVKPIEIT